MLSMFFSKAKPKPILILIARADADMSKSNHNQNQKSKSTKSAPQKRPIPVSQELASKEPVPKKVRKQKKHAMGISVVQVSNRGREPQCQYCREQISREQWHTVKQTSGQKEQWKNTAHYHFNCYNFLNKVERQQLLTLIEHGDYMDHDSLQNLKESMNEDN